MQVEFIPIESRARVDYTIVSNIIMFDMQHILEDKGNLLQISLRGQFTISDKQLFSDIISSLDIKSYNKIVVDLSEIKFIDSAALAKLLLLREKAEKTKAELILSHPQGQVMQMLELSRFNELFQIAL